jgi:hypothetical protein
MANQARDRAVNRQAIVATHATMCSSETGNANTEASSETPALTTSR